MRIAFVLDDELYKRLKVNGVNVSETCRRALREEVELIETEPEGIEVIEAIHKWARQGRKHLRELEDFLA